MIRFLFAGIAVMTLAASPAAAAYVSTQSEAIGSPYNGDAPRDFENLSSFSLTSLTTSSAVDQAFSYQNYPDPTVINAHAIGSASGYANLATGKVGAAAKANIDAEASARSVISDTLTFSGQSDDPIILTIRHHGFYSTDPTGISESFLTLGVGGVEGVFGSVFRNVGAQSTSYYQKGLYTNYGGPGIGMSAITAVLIDDQSSDGVFDRTFRITLDSASFNGLGFFLDLGAYAGNGATAMFDQTGSLTVTPPPGVTFSSQSGVFPGSTAAAVPEPVSWALMLVGFGLAGGALRRRRSVAVVA